MTFLCLYPGSKSSRQLDDFMIIVNSHKISLFVCRDDTRNVAIADRRFMK
jgi:hypothetical protein